MVIGDVKEYSVHVNLWDRWHCRILCVFIDRTKGAMHCMAFRLHQARYLEPS
jgi:hypothetical protein